MVAHKILVSAQGPLVLVLSLKGLGPGLDKNAIELFLPLVKEIVHQFRNVNCCR